MFIAFSSILLSHTSWANTCLTGNPSVAVFGTKQEAKSAAYKCAVMFANGDGIRGYLGIQTITCSNRLFSNETHNIKVDGVITPHHCDGNGLCGFNIARRVKVGTDTPHERYTCPIPWKNTYNGRSRSGGYFQYLHECQHPFVSVDGQCVTYCPKDKPNLDIEVGVCYSDKEQEEQEEQCELNPVIMGSGEKAETAIDLEIKSPFPIVIQRSYRSNRFRETTKYRAQAYSNVSSDLLNVLGSVKYMQPNGYSNDAAYKNDNAENFVSNGVEAVGYQNWSYSFKGRIIEGVDVVHVTVGSESEFFDKVEQNNEHIAWYNSKSKLFKIKDNTSGFTTWKYEKVSGETILFDDSEIIKITNSKGLSHNITKESSTHYKIEDEFNNWASIRLGYNNEVISVEGSNGITINYTYDQYGNLASMVKKMPSLGNETSTEQAFTKLTKKYHYENLNFPYALTGITDEKGIRYATWVYDELGRVIQSKHANNVDNGTITYEANTTTVTNALGKSTKYHYDTVAGARRLVSVEGVPTAFCTAANKAYTYYENGRIKTQTDWEGNVMYLEYNTKGQVTKRTEAYGTPHAITTETTWHTDFDEPVLIKYQNKKETFKYDQYGNLINKTVSAI